MTTEGQDPEEESPEPTDIRFVGPATAAVLENASVDASSIPGKTVSYAMLVEAGVNPGVAARIRREHSLSWSFEGSSGEDLARRSSQVRGLREDERAWIAASGGEWKTAEPKESTEADGSGAADEAEAAWRDRSPPTPVTEVPGIGAVRGEKLAEAGITSVRSLAATDPDRVADVLGLPVSRVTRWRDAARELRS